MSPPTNPRIEVCPETAQSLHEIAALTEPDSFLGNFEDVSPGSSFRLVVAAEVAKDVASVEAQTEANTGVSSRESGDVNRQEQYFILRRTSEKDGDWYDWRLHAGDAVEGKAVVLYGAVTENGNKVDVGSIVKGMGFLVAEVDLHPLGEPAPEGSALIADGVLATRFFNLGVVKRAIGIPTNGSTTSGAAES